MSYFSAMYFVLISYGTLHRQPKKEYDLPKNHMKCDPTWRSNLIKNQTTKKLFGWSKSYHINKNNKDDLFVDEVKKLSQSFLVD